MTRKERAELNRKKHARERAGVVLSKHDKAAAVDPLDEPPMDDRPPLKPIPWNKVELTADERQAVADALLEHYPRNQIAKALGTTVKTLKRLIDQTPDLSDAVDCAKDAEEAELRDLLMRNAKNGSDVAALFLLKTRHGYVDRPDGGKAKGQDGKGGVLVVPAPVDLDTFSEMIKRQQAPHRERHIDEFGEAGTTRTSTVTGEGVRMQRLLPGDRPN